MHCVTNLFPVMGVQNLSKSVKICQSSCKKFTATCFMPHSVFLRTRILEPCLAGWRKIRAEHQVLFR